MPSPQPATITRLLDAVYPSFALLAGMELDLFTHLKDGPLSAKDLADAIGVQTDKLSPLLYVLVAAGLLTTENALFANTSEANHYLVRGKPAYLGGQKDLAANNWSRVLKTAATIRAGGPLEEYNYHMPSYDELIALFRGLYPGVAADAQRLMDHYDWSSYRTLVDVGGGSGALAIMITEAHPQLHATVVDLPPIIPITQQFIHEADATDRIDVLAADVVSDTLVGWFDVVVVRHVVQVLSVEDSRALLNNLAGVVKPGGAIYLIGWILDDSRLTPQNIVGYNLILLNGYYQGQAYTEREYREWLDGAGFEAIERTVFSDGTSIMAARMPVG